MMSNQSQINRSNQKMSSEKLEQSRRTTSGNSLSGLIEGLEERAFDIEIEKMYIDKLRQQRQKIESVSSHYQALKEELERKDLQLAEKDRRMAALTETVVSKRKYEELMRELKICERERDKARGQLEQLKVQLDQSQIEKSLAVKELKAYLKDTDFKYTEELAELRELVDEKQKLIDSLKLKQVDELRRLTQQAQQEAELARVNSEAAAQEQAELKEQNQVLLRTLSERENLINELKVKVQDLDSTVSALGCELEAKQAQTELLNDEYRRVFQKMKFHMRAVRKQLKDREEQIEQFKQNINKANNLIRKADTKYLILLEDYKKGARVFQDKLTRSAEDWSDQRKNLFEAISELKGNLDHLTKVNSVLLVQKDKLTSVIKRKDMTDKIRQEFIKAENSELDRVERLIRKL